MKTQRTSQFCWFVLALLGVLGFSAQLPAADPGFPTVVHLLATDPDAAEEGSDPATFTVLRLGPTNQSLTVQYAVGGTAVNGEDYERLSGTVTIPEGAYAAAIIVTPIDDFLVEGGELVVVALTQPPVWPPPYVVSWPSIGLAHIVDNDPGPTNHPPAVAIVNPPDGAVFTAPVDVAIVARAYDRDGRVVTVEFFADGTSLGIVTNRPPIIRPYPIAVDRDGSVLLELEPELYPDVDLDPGTGPVPIPIPINLFRLVWSNVPPGDHVLTAVATDNLGASTTSGPIQIKVLEAPQQPVVTVLATDPEAAEPDPAGTHLDTATFTLHRTGDTDFPLTVWYRLSGTASNGLDYRELPTSVTIPEGQSTVEVVVEPIDDNLVEGDESVILTILPPICIEIWPPPRECYLVGRPHVARAVIHDNDVLPNRPPVVQIVRPLDGSVFIAPATIQIVAHAWDFDGLVVSVEFFEGTNSLGVVSNNGLSASSLRPPFMLTWSNVPPGKYVLTAVATDDDGATGRSRPVKIRVVPRPIPPVVNIEATDPVASEPGILTVIDTATFRVSRTGPTQFPLLVHYRIGGTAANGVDYRRIPEAVVIPSGASSTNIIIDPLHDTLVEGDESVVLTLEPPICIAIYPPPPECYYVIGSNRVARAVIRDNDFPPTNQPPRVAIVRPENGDMFEAFTDIPIFAAAFDVDGFVRTVEFFANGNSLGIVTNTWTTSGAGNTTGGLNTHPEQIFRLVWRSVPTGRYLLTAEATDNRGATSVSEPVGIRVMQPPVVPVVTIVATDPFASEGYWGPIPLEPTGANSGSNVGIIGPPSILDTATFTVRRSTGTNVDLVVYYSVSGTASNGVDYRLLSGRVTVPRGSLSANIVVVPIDDNLSEPTETVVVRLLPPPWPTGIDPNVPPGTFVIEGVMRFVGVEGGCWQFVAADGTRYELFGELAASLRQEGLQAQLRVRRRPDLGSICMIGEIVEVIAILDLRPSYIVGDPDRAVAYIRDNDFNLSPKVEIVRPPDEAIFFAPADIGIHVVARDPDGWVWKVEFFEGTNRIGVQEIHFIVPPPPGEVQQFSMIWSNVPSGSYVLTARATDNRGAVSVSDPIRVRVLGIVPIPIVTIRATDPIASEIDPRLDVIPDTATFTVHRTGDLTRPLRVFYRVGGTASNGVDYQALSGEVEIPRNAATAEILIDVIDDELVEGTETVIIELIQLRCVTTTVDPPEGCYLVGQPSRDVAYIRDDDAPPNRPPTVAIVNPPNGAVFTAPADIRLVAAADDPDGWVATVEFFANNVSLGIVTNRPWILEPVRLADLNGVVLASPSVVPIPIPIPPPFFLLWTNVPPGKYALTAVATDNLGATTRSRPVEISVMQPGHRPIVSIFAIDGLAREGTANTATFLVRRVGSTNQPLTVLYHISGTAVNGVDYVLIPNTVTIPAGRRSARIVITPIDDRIPEPIETVILRLQPPPVDPPPYQVGRPEVAGAIIVDNDRPEPSTVRLSDGNLHVRISLASGLPYRLEASTNLLTWEAVASGIVPEDNIHFVEGDKDQYSRRFYRVVPDLEVLMAEE